MLTNDKNMNELDAEVVFRVKRYPLTRRWVKGKSKKGPRLMRVYRIALSFKFSQWGCGKHRGHVPQKFDECMNFERFLSCERENLLRTLALTPEQQVMDRETFGRTPGWVRKYVVNELHHPVPGRLTLAARNPQPVQMTARYTGHLQPDDRVRVVDAWSGRAIEGLVHAITIYPGVATIVTITTANGTQYEAPVSEVTKL